MNYPEGTSLDLKTGEIAGRVPYHPTQITKEYKFTVTVLGAGTGVDFVTVNIIPHEDQQQGSINLKLTNYLLDSRTDLMI